jgi:type IV pilus assembly protein PilA
MKYHISRAGFTLIEVLLVIAILAVLAAITIVAINPSKQLATARDAQRRSDVYTILNAIHQYVIDNEGSYPGGLDTTSLEICRTTSVDCNNLYDFQELTDNQTYMVSMPLDPLCAYDGAYCSDNGTGYFVELTEGGRVMVSSPGAEEAESIEVTR